LKFVGNKAKLGWTWTTEKDGYIGLDGIFFFLSQMGEGKETQTGALDGLFKKKRKEKRKKKKEKKTNLCALLRVSYFHLLAKT
jgi:hypothetical protein